MSCACTEAVDLFFFVSGALVGIILRYGVTGNWAVRFLLLKWSLFMFMVCVEGRVDGPDNLLYCAFTAHYLRIRLQHSQGTQRILH